MSPEQARGEDLDARSDLFSFGLVLYEMTTGQRTFQGSTSAVIFDAILNREPAAPIELNANVPAALERIIAKLLDKDKEGRYHSAIDVRADLQQVKLERSTTTMGSTRTLPHTASPSSRSGAHWPSAKSGEIATAPSRRRISAAALLVGLFGVIALVAASWLFFQAGNRSAETQAPVVPTTDAPADASTPVATDAAPAAPQPATPPAPAPAAPAVSSALRPDLIHVALHQEHLRRPRQLRRLRLRRHQRRRPRPQATRWPSRSRSLAQRPTRSCSTRLLPISRPALLPVRRVRQLRVRISCWETSCSGRVARRTPWLRTSSCEAGTDVRLKRPRARFSWPISCCSRSATIGRRRRASCSRRSRA